MATFKLSFWLSVLFVTAVLAISFLNFSTELVSRPDIVLTSDSVQYVADFGGYVSDSGIDNTTTQDTATLKEDEFIGDDNETGQQSVTDFLANLNFFKSRFEKIKNFIKMVYNIPTFLILSLGIPIEPFGWFSNLVNLVIYISLIVVFVKAITGNPT